MKIVITLFILMSCCGNVFGRQQFDTAAVVKKQANEMCTGFVNGNIKILAKYTHPVIIKSIGGADKMEATIKQGLEQMKKQGMGFQSVTTGKPSKIIREGGEWQCTIPEQIKMKMPQGTLTSNSTLIGLSADGKKWYFIDVSGHSLTQIRKVLPEVSTHLVIPPKQQPVLMPR